MASILITLVILVVIGATLEYQADQRKKGGSSTVGAPAVWARQQGKVENGVLSGRVMRWGPA